MATKERIYVKGHTGILSVKDASTYKPLVCLTSTSVDRSANTSEVVNYCTEGETITQIDSISRSVSFDAVIVDESDLDGGTGYADLVAIMETKESHMFKIEGRDGNQFFSASITSLSDTFPGDGNATFSGTMTVLGEFLATEPSA
ncbi:MAG TPA: hypothetical protein VFD80_01770 [Flavobacteriaceae bacterium]|nr:hypothetical protein [Flavobacteriaceae bacterium]